MRKKAWIHQLKSQVTKHGADKASWYVSWKNPDGDQKTKSCGPGPKGKALAAKMADKLHSQLIEGTYEDRPAMTWPEFRAEYKAKILDGMGQRSQEAATDALDNFERLAKPKRPDAMKADTVDAFIALRRKEPGRGGKTLSPASVNRDLRYVKAMLRVAVEWGLMKAAPRIRFLREQEKLPTFVPPEHLTAMYAACNVATFPKRVPNVSPEDWWKGLLALASMTGWRISQMLALKWVDVDLDAAIAISRADDNKGKRDQRIDLHPVVVEHFRKLAGSFDAKVFPWKHGASMLWTQFDRIQEATRLPDGSPLPKAGKGGHWYGFHDLRRGFATANALSMNLFQLQSLMQHRTLETTERYVAMAKQVTSAVAGLYVPEALRKAAVESA